MLRLRIRALANVPRGDDAARMHRFVLAASALCSLLASVRGQGTCGLQVDGALHGVSVVGDASWRSEGRSVRAELPTGRWQFRFFAGEGSRPAPLEVDAPKDGFVHVVAGIAPRREANGEETTTRRRAVREVLAERAESTTTFATATHADVRLAARVRLGDGNSTAGIACRQLDADNHYRLVLDGPSRELQLLRAMGGALRVMQRRAVKDIAVAHDLELEAEGFRLVASIDGEVAFRAFDGGLDEGVCATFVAGGSTATFEGVVADAPALPAASLAVAQQAMSAEVVAAAPHAAGNPFFLCLALDRAEPLRIVDDAGFATFVLVRSADPSLMPFACGFGSSDGAMRGELSWPIGPAFRFHVALVGGVVGTPDASALQERLPRAVVRF